MNETHVVPSGTSVFREQKTDKAVLCIHGYTGFPYDMKYMADVLFAEGYTTHIPRLPGHATNKEDFLKTNCRDWLLCAQNAYLDLAAHYKEVLVLGFSMGGIMSLILASHFEIPQLVLVAPALLVHNKNVGLTPFIWPFVHKIRSSPLCNGETKDHTYLFPEYWQWGYPKNIAQFYKLQKQGQKILPQVTSDILTIVSEQDETVPVEVATLIEKKSNAASFEKVVLKRSPHVMLDADAPEKEEVRKYVLQWLKKQGGKQ